MHGIAGIEKLSSREKKLLIRTFIRQIILNNKTLSNISDYEPLVSKRPLRRHVYNGSINLFVIENGFFVWKIFGYGQSNGKATPVNCWKKWKNIEGQHFKTMKFVHHYYHVECNVDYKNDLQKILAPSQELLNKFIIESRKKNGFNQIIRISQILTHSTRIYIVGIIFIN